MSAEQWAQRIILALLQSDDRAVADAYRASIYDLCPADHEDMIRLLGEAGVKGRVAGAMGRLVTALRGQN
jgi:hypothetical protein